MITQVITNKTAKQDEGRTYCSRNWSRLKEHHQTHRTYAKRKISSFSRQTVVAPVSFNYHRSKSPFHKKDTKPVHHRETDVPLFVALPEREVLCPFSTTFDLRCWKETRREQGWKDMSLTGWYSSCCCCPSF